MYISIGLADRKHTPETFAPVANKISITATSLEATFFLYCVEADDNSEKAAAKNPLYCVNWNYFRQ